MAQPRAEDFDFDLDAALRAVVGLTARIPADAFTAETLGTERAGNAVLIGKSGLFATIGYLITEAQSVWLTTNDGHAVEGHALGFDQESGFGLVQALGRVDAQPLPLGSSRSGAGVGTSVVVAGAGGRKRAVAAQVVARQEFAGYWEYLVDEAIFTVPSHPHWGGTAVIGASGELLGIGSLQLQQERSPKRVEPLNMSVPIDLLPPIVDEIVAAGRPLRPPRPWLGIFATEVDGQVAIAGTVGGGPAEKAGVETGDFVLRAAGQAVSDLASLFRGIWALGEAGVAVPLTIKREGRIFDVTVQSADRYRLLKGRTLH